ncbi:DUF2188 domain-containing protein [[Mycoplasma] mobile]|uniref:Expressed protein n=1 Tax=Mycoplasma mobile (strain ATCC 43663 / 163K / NCTC 11711) TaxID=267748 RepID=Q6KID1_MYCM1|nr:DUF2188 domain-containing protein [[Mycoplasma] mobile]AAT27645.1 expressed protein [Mycoplasma mobile 163K]
MIKYVVNHDGKWAVKNANAEKVTKVCDTQKEAIDYAKSLDNTSAIMIQGRDGKFRKG